MSQRQFYCRKNEAGRLSSTKGFQNKEEEKSERESVAWREIRWIGFLKNMAHQIFYKTSLNDDATSHILDLSPKKGRPNL